MFVSVRRSTHQKFTFVWFDDFHYNSFPVGVNNFPEPSPASLSPVLVRSCDIPHISAVFGAYHFRSRFLYRRAVAHYGIFLKKVERFY
jgi:hypothetical protein